MYVYKLLSPHLQFKLVTVQSILPVSGSYLLAMMNLRYKFILLPEEYSSSNVFN